MGASSDPTLGAGAFFEQFLGGDHGFLGFGLLGEHVFAARLALGFVFAAGDIDRHLHAHFGMQHHVPMVQADGLDRLVERHLGAVDGEAAR